MIIIGSLEQRVKFREPLQSSLYLMSIAQLYSSKTAQDTFKQNDN